jgi:hypothetical protein
MMQLLRAPHRGTFADVRRVLSLDLALMNRT